LEDNLSAFDLPILKRLTELGKTSFKKLCELGCEPLILGDYLDLLPPQKLPPRTISLDEAKQIAGRAKNALSDINHLEKLRILDLMYPFSVNEHTPHSEVFFAKDVLKEIADLPKTIKKIWPPWNQDYESYLSAIYNYVHTETQHWNDELLADILNDLFPADPDHPIDSRTLNQWRYRHGLTVKRKSK